MSRVGIATDSISCLPAELIKGYDIRVVPLSISINGKAYRDQVEITPAEFWRLFPEMKEFTTGAPALGNYAEIFKELGNSNDSIVGMVNNTGVIENLSGDRGKRKCMLRMVDMVKEHIDTDKPLHVIVHYTDRIEDGGDIRAYRPASSAIFLLLIADYES